MKFIVLALKMHKRVARFMLQRVFVTVGNREFGLQNPETWTIKNPSDLPEKAIPTASCPDGAGSADVSSPSTAEDEATKERSPHFNRLRHRRKRLLKRGRSIRITVNED